MPPLTFNDLHQIFAFFDNILWKLSNHTVNNLNATHFSIHSGLLHFYYSSMANIKILYNMPSTTPILTHCYGENLYYSTNVFGFHVPAMTFNPNASSYISPGLSLNALTNLHNTPVIFDPHLLKIVLKSPNNFIVYFTDPLHNQDTFYYFVNMVNKGRFKTLNSFKNVVSYISNHPHVLDSPNDVFKTLIRKYALNICRILFKNSKFNRILSNVSKNILLNKELNDLMNINPQHKYYFNCYMDFRGRIYIHNTSYNFQQSKLIRGLVKIPTFSIISDFDNYSNILLDILYNDRSRDHIVAPTPRIYDPSYIEFGNTLLNTHFTRNRYRFRTTHINNAKNPYLVTKTLLELNNVVKYIATPARNSSSRIKCDKK